MAKPNSTKWCAKCQRRRGIEQFRKAKTGSRLNWCKRCCAKDADRRRWLAAKEKTTQVCNACKKPFPATLEYFYAHPQGRHGLLPKCIPCVLAYRKKHNRRWARTWREKCLLHYSGGDHIHCVCCGETRYEFMSLDHIDGGGRQQRLKSGYNNESWYLKMIRDGFPERLRTLCHNCNMSLGHYGYCPHEREREAAKK